MTRIRQSAFYALRVGLLGRLENGQLLWTRQGAYAAARISSVRNDVQLQRERIANIRTRTVTQNWNYEFFPFTEVL